MLKYSKTEEVYHYIRSFDWRTGGSNSTANFAPYFIYACMISPNTNGPIFRGLKKYLGSNI